MRKGRLIIILLSGLFYLAGCDNNPGKDTGRPQPDSIAANERADIDSIRHDACHEDFFGNLARFSDSNSAYLVWRDGKRRTLTQFFKDEFMSPMSHYGKKDMDGDGKIELIIFNNTGGAHCCDEYYFFGQKNDTEFEYQSHIMGGQTCIDSSTNIINYSFGETLGYFFSCYACEFEDSTGKFKMMREVKLKYAGSKFEVVKYDSLAAAQNLRNLAVLQEHGYEKVVGLMDNGWRKEFAINLAIWHYNHNKNWKETKQLFSRYYNFADAPKVWSEFYRTILESEKENSF